MSSLLREFIREILSEKATLDACEKCGLEPGSNDNCSICSSLKQNDAMDRQTIPVPPPDYHQQLKNAEVRNKRRKSAPLYKPAPDDSPTIRPPKMS